MDTETGHLATAIFLKEALKDNEKEIEGLFEERLGDNYTPIPEELNAAAEEALAGKEETTIDVEGDSGLAKWARRMNRRRQEE